MVQPTRMVCGSCARAVATSALAASIAPMTTRFMHDPLVVAVPRPAVGLMERQRGAARKVPQPCFLTHPISDCMAGPIAVGASVSYISGVSDGDPNRCRIPL